jgi:hypothetical protein
MLTKVFAGTGFAPYGFGDKLVVLWVRGVKIKKKSPNLLIPAISG